MRDAQYSGKLIGLAGLVQAEMRCALWQDIPVYDYPTSTLTLNITVISDPAYLKFSDGIARQTYQNALAPNRFARVSPYAARTCHGSPGMLPKYNHIIPRTRSMKCLLWLSSLLGDLNQVV